MKQATALGVNRKLGILLFVSVAGMVGIMLVFYQAFSLSLNKDKRAETRRLVEVGLGVIQYFYGLEQSGAMPSGEAKRLSMSALKAATFKDHGYFWINDGSGVLVMQPYTPEMVGTNMLDVQGGEGLFLFREFVRVSKEGGGWVNYTWLKTVKGGLHRKVSFVAYFEPWDWVLGTGLYLHDMEAEIKRNSLGVAAVLLVALVSLMGIFMTLIRRFLRELQGLAIHDELTGLYTRRYLTETLGNLLLLHDRHLDKNLSVIFLDIDHFKQVNDSYGHGKGDEVLREVGWVIREMTRPDDLCIRYGGEEFVVVILTGETQTARHLAERIRKAVHGKVFQGNGHSFSITLSVGIAMRQGRESFDVVLARADEKLYEAKANGRDCIVA